MGGVLLAVLLAALVSTVAIPQRQDDSLPWWNDGAARTRILEFVRTVTQPGSPTFVPPDQRIATFDNDGTLWVEKPTYIEVYFVLERVKALRPQHPEWSTSQPFKAVLDDDLAALEQLGSRSCSSSSWPPTPA